MAPTLTSTVEPALRALLTAHEGLEGLGGRIYPAEAGIEAERPYAVYRVTERRTGPGTTGALAAWDVVIDLVGDTYAQVADLVAACRTLHGLKGWVQGCDIRGLFVTDGGDDLAPAVAGRDQGIHWRSLLLTIWVRGD